MTHSEEQELLELTRLNNALLKIILQLVLHDEGTDFIHNLMANLIANKMDGGNLYGYKTKNY